MPAQEWAGRTDTGDAVSLAGEPLTFDLDAAAFRPDLLIERPDELSANLTATPELEEEEPGLDGPPITPEELRLTAAYRDTDLPGVYKVRLTTTAGEPADRWTALNFPPAESRLALADGPALASRLADTAAVTIQEAGDASWLRGGERGREVRWWLLGTIAALLAGELALADRCGYHGTGAAA